MTESRMETEGQTMRTLRRVAAAVGVTMIGAQWLVTHAVAADMPGYYPQAFGFIGTVNAVYRDDHRMVVDDHSISFSQDMRVHTLDTQFGTIRQIQVGMRVAIDPPPLLKNTAREVWVLPDDFRQSERTER